jgi:hypothetical protein
MKKLGRIERQQGDLISILTKIRAHPQTARQKDRQRDSKVILLSSFYFLKIRIKMV